jgi:hypothetical protein
MLHTYTLPDLDYSRHTGLLDHDLMAATTVACAGTGGAAGLVLLLARCGIRNWVLADLDLCSATSPTTQAYQQVDIAHPKVLALASHLRKINCEVEVTPFGQRYEYLSAAGQAKFWSADVALAMTDNFATQSLINSDALAARVDTFFAICYIGCGAVEVTATLFPLTAGCHRCHTKIRYDAYEQGFVNPATIASHAIAAEFLNSIIAMLVVARVHQRAGSRLPITELAHAFAERPCLISRLLPSFGVEPGGAFAGLPPAAFCSRLFPLDTPTDWVCPDCGTRGVVAPQALQSAPDARAQEPTTSEGGE